MHCHAILLRPVPSSTTRSPFPVPSPRQLQGALNEFRSGHEDRLHQVLKNSSKLSRLYQKFCLLSCSTRLYNFYIFSHPYGYSSVQALQPFATQHDFYIFLSYSNDPTSTICSTVPALCQSCILRHLRSSHGSVTFTSGATLEGSKRHRSADFLEVGHRFRKCNQSTNFV